MYAFFKELSLVKNFQRGNYKVKKVESDAW